MAQEQQKNRKPWLLPAFAVLPLALRFNCTDILPWYPEFVNHNVPVLLLFCDNVTL
jgi:hypothetical protein